MFSEGMEAASPPCGSRSHGAKGLWALGGLTVSTVVGHRTGHKPCGAARCSGGFKSLVAADKAASLRK